MICIHVFPAKNGDCFLISVDESVNILVDAGYPETCNQYLIPKLKELSDQGKEIDLFVITHIDDDHIGGAIDLLEQNGSAKSPKIIRIKEVWHNSYKHISQIKSDAQLLEKQSKQLNEIIKQAQRVRSKLKNQEEEISAKQGSTLAAHLLKGDYSWNQIAMGKAISANNVPEVILGNDLKIVLLSPGDKQLLALDKYWKEELYKCGFNQEIFSDNRIFDDAFELLLQFPDYEQQIEQDISFLNEPEKAIEIALSKKYYKDNSPKNGSSIAFVLEKGEKKLLFLGDAFAEVIEENLRNRYFKEEDTSIEIEVLKISHHGSKANNSPSLINLINARFYIFSTDGSQHNHPNFETLARVLTKKYLNKKSLIFNYKTKQSELLNVEKLKEKYNYELNYTSYLEIE